MTTETTTPSAIDQAQAEVDAIRKDLEAANAEAATKVAAIMAVQPVDFIALAEASKPVATLTAKLERAETSLKEARANDAWVSSAETREPTMEVLRNAAKDMPSVKAASVRGRIDITPDGISVDASVVMPQVDLSSFETALAESVNADEFKSHAWEHLTFEIKSDGTISFAPTSSATAAKPKSTGTTSSDGTRSGALEYNYNGEWLGSKAMLEAMRSANDPIVNDHAKAFTTVLDGNGNGLSNLAKLVAGKLKLESRTASKA